MIRRVFTISLASLIAGTSLVRTAAQQPGSLVFPVAAHSGGSTNTGNEGSTAAEAGQYAAPNLMPAADGTVEGRRTSNNGIFVEQLKIYDDALLQTMLSAAQARLAALDLIDKTGIAARLGALSGAEQRSTGFSLSVQTPNLPSVATTEKGATGSTDETITTQPGASASTTQVVTKSGLGATDVVTTQPQTAPPTVTAAGSTLALPTNVGVSASDLLNEQLQLTFEIANLRLLLDGALSDRLFTTSADIQLADGTTAQVKVPRSKPRFTIGVPITIDPDDRYKDAVAVVELEIERGNTLSTGESPSITALLPREKTYNVAAIRESNVSIGGGLVTQVIGFGGSWLSGRKTYYVVQDQDTVAATFPTGRPHTLGVAWHFRPVLGERFVKPGLKQTFVQVAFPSSFGESNIGKVTVRTYWRKFDRKTGAAKELVKGSVAVAEPWAIPSFTTLIPRPDLGANLVEDLGAGNLMIDVEGAFLLGTAIRVGNTYVREGAASTYFSHRRVKFVASAFDLATKRVAIVGRDGEERPLIMSGSRPGVQETAGDIVTVTATPIDETNSLLTLQLKAQPPKRHPGLVLLVGNRVFGYSDSPLHENGSTLSAAVPTSLLVANPVVTLTAILAPEGFAVSAPIQGLDRRSRVERLTLIGETADKATFVLYGYRLRGASVLLPTGVTLGNVGDGADVETIRLVTIAKADLKTQKYLVLQRPNERPVAISIPGVTPAAPPPALKARARILVNTDLALFESERLKELTKVTFEKRELPFEVAKDGKTVTVRGLNTAGVSAKADEVSLEFSFGELKATATLDVVNAKVETVPRGER